MESLQSLLWSAKSSSTLRKEEYGLKLNSFVILNFYSLFISSSCFPHIVNLACKATISTITDLKYVDDMVEDYNDYEPGAFSRDCIAIVRSLVNAVSNITFFSILLLLKKKADS